jgi:hypothetical protein
VHLKERVAAEEEMEMPSLGELSNWIRDYLQDARNRQQLLAQRFNWHQLCAGLDTIEDTELAIVAYVQSDFPSDAGEGYLRIYGVLQALFLQQDALEHFLAASGWGLTTKVRDVLRDVREARTAAVGHPTQLNRKGDLSTHVISRSTLRKDGFDLMSFAKKSGEDPVSFRYVAVCDLIEKQRVEVIRIMSEVVTKLKQEDRMHKEAFREKKLKACFNQVGYAFEKISEELRGAPAIFGAWGVGHLRTVLNEFERLLNERGIRIDTYDSIKYLRLDIEYPLAHLTKFVNGEPCEIASREAAQVFVKSLDTYFSELMHIAEEIDNEYSAAATAGG